ncbi:MAG: aspartate aminotransferase family protein [Limnochordia bacterium]|jgi:4-aminobutyrate aminotransferase/(S)-3-amino-2-methylpropionate transaminase
MVFQRQPRMVPRVETKYRRIQTEIPAPETMPVLEKLAKYEPQATASQPPIVWDRAEGFQVYDRAGNKWIDFTSGVLVANTGFFNEDIYRAILGQLDKGLWHTFLFANEPRAALAEKLVEIAPPGLDTVFLLTTGSETTENALKQMRSYGLGRGGRDKIGIITFEGAFHGRTLGAQQIGGIPSLKEWIVNLDPNIYQLPFPDCFACPWGKEGYDDCDGECFDRFCDEVARHLDSRDFGRYLAGVITESYQGGQARFMPVGFVQRMAAWCRENDILLTFDEVQAGFGRTGKFFAFEHYGVQPDLICCGKGISGSLPLSAVLGRREILTQFPPGALTNTHSGNPLSCAAALKNIEIILEQRLTERAAQLGALLRREIDRIAAEYPSCVGPTRVTGLVAGIDVVDEEGAPASALAARIVARTVEKGVLLFAPVGPGPATIKINPPLIIDEEALVEGIRTLHEAFGEVLEEGI